MNDLDLTHQVTDEIKALHVEFNRWFKGESDDPSRVESSLANDFWFISPQGEEVPRNDLMANFRGAHGKGDFFIRIDNVCVVWSSDEAILATYEEWHLHSGYTTIRHSTVLLTRDDTTPGGFLWRHVHETWKMPPPHRQVKR